ASARAGGDGRGGRSGGALGGGGERRGGGEHRRRGGGGGAGFARRRGGRGRNCRAGQRLRVLLGRGRFGRGHRATGAGRALRTHLGRDERGGGPARGGDVVHAQESVWPRVVRSCAAACAGDGDRRGRAGWFRR